MSDLSESAKGSGWLQTSAEGWNKRPEAQFLDDLPFWEDCAQRFGDPILDLGCGTGRLSFALAERGYRVVGVDVNQDFIGWARGQVTRTDTRLDVSFYVQDVVSVKLAQRFRLAIMPSWSFQYLLFQEDQISFLRNLRMHLEKNGVFAFNLFMSVLRQYFLRDRGVRVWLDEVGILSQPTNTFNPISQVEDIDGVRMRHTSLEELKLLLKLTGFEMIELYGDVDKSPVFPVRKNSDYNVVARAT